MMRAATSLLGEEDEATVRAAYPGPTWDRLRELKRRYDPDNLFRLNHNIPPADGWALFTIARLTAVGKKIGK
jgi:hypothetical protein